MMMLRAAVVSSSRSVAGLSSRSFFSTQCLAQRRSEQRSRQSKQQQQQQQRAHSRLLLGVAGALTAAALGAELWRTSGEGAQASGIIACVGDDPAVPYLLEGLTMLQANGYDSAGMATINAKGAFDVTKFAGQSSHDDDCIARLQNEAPAKHGGAHVGIAHTRWATHGQKTECNAHPHLDAGNRIAVVHNGAISNSNALREELEKEGVRFRSQTDSEVIAQLVGSYIDKKMPLMDAVKKTLSRLEGTWGIALLSRGDPHTIIAARHGSPLVVGIAQGRTFVASEAAAFARFTSQFIALNDGEVAVLRKGDNALDLSRVEHSTPVPARDAAAAGPAPFAHWTLKEITEQPDSVARTLNYGGRLTHDGRVKLGGPQQHLDLMRSIKHMVVTGMGSSLYAAMFGVRLMRELRCFESAQFLEASEVGLDDFPISNGGIAVVSQSGQTRDSQRATCFAEIANIPRLSIVNTVGSPIARATKCGVYLNSGREHSVVATKSFTSEVVALALLASWFSQNKYPGSCPEDGAFSPPAADAPAEQPVSTKRGWLSRLFPRKQERDGAVSPSQQNIPNASKEGRSAQAASSAGSSTGVGSGSAEEAVAARCALLTAVCRLPACMGTVLQQRQKCAQVAEKLTNAGDIFVLGKGFAEPIAYEGALKLKELGEAHAEGYSGGALKHGPFALLQEGTPVVLLIFNDQHAELMRIAAAEVKARGAYNVVITDNPHLARGCADDVLVVPHNGPLTALLAALPLQLIAYELALKKGINPDRPRNLAKSLHVD